jgi:hypothetical protein
MTTQPVPSRPRPVDAARPSAFSLLRKFGFSVEQAQALLASERTVFLVPLGVGR